jgi:hypothetical protein
MLPTLFHRRAPLVAVLLTYCLVVTYEQDQNHFGSMASVGATPNGAVINGSAVVPLVDAPVSVTSPFMQNGWRFQSPFGTTPSDVSSVFVPKPLSEVSLISARFGHRFYAENLPPAGADVQPIRFALANFRAAQGTVNSATVTARVFGAQTTGNYHRVRLPWQQTNIEVGIAEFLVAYNGRDYLIRMSRQISTAADELNLLAAVGATTVSAAQSAGALSTSPSLQRSHAPVPASSLRPASSTRASTLDTGPPGGDSTYRLASARIPMLPNAASVPPVWWSGTCNSNNHSGSAALQSWNGLTACGPGPYAGGYDVPVTFPGAANTELEWECAELSKRYMYLQYHIPDDYSANGSQVVPNYPGNALAKIPNGTPNSPPMPGDVISFGSTSDQGHTGVVIASGVDGDGNGSITILDQNDEPWEGGNPGTQTYTVSNWVVAGEGWGWLHPR